jgi:hypothetical protein
MKAGGPPAFQIRLRSRRVQRELDRLPEVDYQRTLTKIKALAHDPQPRGCEKLAEDIYPGKDR